MQNRTTANVFVTAIGVCAVLVKQSDSRLNLERQGKGKKGRFYEGKLLLFSTQKIKLRDFL